MNQPVFWQPEASYRLKTLEMFNWGGFNGYHPADVDMAGTAVIGPTGSGKTTLVDALMTLLCANPRYNLASTGGHESDRDLVSYVRGASGPGDGANQSKMARPGKTITGIVATLDNGEHIARLGVLLWFDDSSSSASDLKKLWFFTTNIGQTLEHWLEVQHEGGMRALRQLEKTESGLWIYSSKKAYLARIRDFFDVRENAFNLLNRAAGLKQLNSIDDIFRDLVLDDTSVFERAKEVADSFDDLTAIHEELETARRQKASLEPIRHSWEKYQQQEKALNEKHTLKACIPVWFGEQAYRLWGDEYRRLEREYQQADAAVAEVDNRYSLLKHRREHLNQAYLQLGGSDIQVLEQLIAERQGKLTRCEQYAGDYQRLVRQLGLSDIMEHQIFLTNKELAQEQEQQCSEALHKAKNAAFGQGVIAKEVQDRLIQLREDLAETEQRPGSNLPSQYQRFRTDLAQELQLDEKQLPFVAELVQIKESEQAWRGAIERAIGSHRLRILIPAEVSAAALRWVNQRHNQLHVRILEVKEPEGNIRFFEDGFTRKLDYKPHSYREAVKALLAGIDRHCVASPELLRSTEHAMTQQGLMSGKARFFDKQDQKRLDQDWMTGFDNRDRLVALQKQLADQQKNYEQLQAQVEQARLAVESLEQRQSSLQHVQGLTFDQIDVASALQSLQEPQEKLARLTSPDSDLAKAKQELEQVEQALDILDQERTDFIGTRGQLDSQLKNAIRQKTIAYNKVGNGLKDVQRQLAQSVMAELTSEQLLMIDMIEREQLEAVQKDIDTLSKKQGALALELARQMSDAQKVDTGALSEVGRELEDVPSYLERLAVLNKEALPEKLERFKSYLNRSSDEGVTQLLTHIDNEVAMIEERLQDVNHTLSRVNFQTGQYLQLVSSRVIHNSLHTLQTAQRKLASSRYVEDEGESHYKALKYLVTLLRDACERNRTLGAKALLDPRYRIEFSVVLISRDTGQQLGKYKGSQSGSGGEKEIFASYVLIASLSYALCPDGSSIPLFSTIVLDEAFSRSSHAVAGRIIAALQEFGLHALFITPNKEMRLLRSHTRSAIVVHRKGMESSLITLSWQELDEQQQQRRERLSNEVSG